MIIIQGLWQIITNGNLEKQKAFERCCDSVSSKAQKILSMSQINQAQETEGLQNVKSLEMMQRFFDLLDFL